MSNKIIIAGPDSVHLLENEPFYNEEILQSYIEKFPQIVPLESLGVVEPFVVIGREVATSAGFIDILCIDGNGVLTVIETKLARNPQIRREVIGQVLEYVGQVTKWSAHDVISTANQYLKDQDIVNLLQSSESQGITEQIESNLRTGNVKALIASDIVPDTLRDTISFINRNSSFDIFVMQIQLYVKESMRIFIPVVYGLTDKPRQGRELVKWNEELFMEEASELDSEIILRIKDLLEFTNRNGSEVRWGTGKVVGSFSFGLNFRGKMLTIFTVFTNGKIAINYGNMKDKFPDQALLAYNNRLNKFPNVNLHADTVLSGKYPSMDIASISQEDNYKTFIQATEELISSCDR